MGVIRTALTKPSLLRTLLAQVRLASRLMREPRVPLFARAIPLLAVGYVMSPLDFVPDVLPFLGQLDDLGIILLALETFIWMCPAPAVEFHRAAIAAGRRFAPMPQAAEVIDAEFRAGR